MTPCATCAMSSRAQADRREPLSIGAAICLAFLDLSQKPRYPIDHLGNEATPTDHALLFGPRLPRDITVG